MCSLVPAPLWHLICTGAENAGSARSNYNGAILDRLSKQHQYQSIIKEPYLMPN